MSSAKKSTTTATPAPTPTAAKKVVAAPVKEAAVKAVAPAKEAAAPVAAPAAVAAPVVEVAPSTEENLISQLAEQSAAFMSKLQQINATIASLKTEYRALEKKWTRELKASQKLSGKRRAKNVNRAPSGFVKPTLISAELASFLEKPVGSEMARTEVTRDINKYIRANNLQDKENGRKINPDAKLAALLKIGKTDELTYFNLQKYMSPHFTKTVKTA